MVQVWGDKMGKMRFVAGAGLVLGCIALLIYSGKDLGAVVMVAVIAASILFTAGLAPAHYWRDRAGCSGFAHAIYSQPYRWDRLVSF
ncbi:MAG: hypothetical protein R2748_29005 [Bryobacterales bacterium]